MKLVHHKTEACISHKLFVVMIYHVYTSTAKPAMRDHIEFHHNKNLSSDEVLPRVKPVIKHPLNKESLNKKTLH